MKTNEARLQIDRERKETEFMRSPSEWPCWPVLPLKHATEKDKHFPAMPRTAVLVEPFQVFESEITSLHPTTLIKAFNSAEAMYIAGWRVD